MNEAGVGRTETLPHRERLSDEQLGNLISSVGNSESKGVVLSTMEHDGVYSGTELYKRFISVQGERTGWRPHRGIPLHYCQLSFYPIGLVAKKKIDADLKTFGYGITEYGEKEGNALIGLLLSFSEKHSELSLLQIWGPTYSTSKSKGMQRSEGTEYKKRAPIVRLEIFKELVTRQLPIRRMDIAYAIGENGRNIGKHLEQLAHSGIISYEATKIGQPYSFYRLSFKRPNETPKKYKHSPSLAKQVYNFFLKSDQSREATSESIANHLIQTNPEMGKLDKENLRDNISRICSYLTKEHYLEGRKFSENLRSEINLSDQQKATLSELVTLINRFQRQDPEILKEGQRKAMEIISNSERVSNLLRKAKENSASANKLNIEERSKYVLSLMQDHSGSTNTDLFTLQDRRPKLSKARLTQITSFLQQNNKITVSQEKNQKHFTAVDIKEPQQS